MCGVLTSVTLAACVRLARITYIHKYGVFTVHVAADLQTYSQLQCKHTVLANPTLALSMHAPVGISAQMSHAVPTHPAPGPPWHVH